MFCQTPFQQEKLSSAEAACRQRELPFTVQRRAVMADLAGRTDHPTADEVYETVRGQCPAISRATVYRVLETFVSLSLIRKIPSPEAKARFDANTRRHHHLLCVQCGCMIDVNDPQLDSLPFPDNPSYGEICDYSVSFTGRCNLCLSQRPHTAV